MYVPTTGRVMPYWDEHGMPRDSLIPMSSCTHLSEAQVQEVLAVLDGFSCTLANFLDCLLCGAHSRIVTDWAIKLMTQTCAKEITQMVKKCDFHFVAAQVTENQLKAMDITDIAHQMQGHAPVTWGLLDVLLAADTNRTYKRKRAQEIASLTKKRCHRGIPKAPNIETGTTRPQADLSKGPDNNDSNNHLRRFGDELPLCGAEEEELPENGATENYSTLLEIVSLILYLRDLINIIFCREK